MRFLWPTVLTHLSSCPISACCAYAFLLVVSISAASSTSNVCSLLTTAHRWCTFWHNLTSAFRPPTNTLWNKRRRNYSSSLAKLKLLILEGEFVIAENIKPRVTNPDTDRAIIETIVWAILYTNWARTEPLPSNNIGPWLMKNIVARIPTITAIAILKIGASGRFLDSP